MSRPAAADSGRSLDRGDVLRVRDHYPYFAVVTRTGGEPWIVSPRTQLEVRLRSVPE